MVALLQAVRLAVMTRAAIDGARTSRSLGLADNIAIGVEDADLRHRRIGKALYAARFAQQILRFERGRGIRILAFEDRWQRAHIAFAHET